MNLFITGSAGFIGYHLAELLLGQGHAVHGYDGMTDYYDVRLKRARHARLRRHPRFVATEAMLEDDAALQAAIGQAAPQAIVHLAAQAGVRYSIDNPRAFIDANVIGSFNVMQGARRQQVRHLLMASTSSVYGANTDMPFAETQKADTPMSFYAATKKATEAMAHSHAHLFGLPVTMFRFFTVYGPWGRPDMALFKFTQSILEGRPIDIYNHGQMWRDFTYVDDLARAIALLIDCPPPPPAPPSPGGAATGPAPPLRGGEAGAASQPGASIAAAASTATAALDRHASLAMTAPSQSSSLRGGAAGAAIQGNAPATTDPTPSLRGAQQRGNPGQRDEASAPLDRHASLAMATPSQSSLRGGEADAAIQPAPRGVEGDSLSPVAPWRVVNIGNSQQVRLLDFVDAIEQCLGIPAIRNYLPMQPGDVPATWADASLLQRLTGYRPQTDFRQGVRQFVEWYREFYAVPQPPR